LKRKPGKKYAGRAKAGKSTAIKAEHSGGAPRHWNTLPLCTGKRENQP
jgi:hypothetical protein